MAPLPRLQQAAKDEDRGTRKTKEIPTRIYGPQRSALDLMLASGGGLTAESLPAGSAASAAAPTSAQNGTGRPAAVAGVGFIAQMRAQRQPADARAKARAARDAAVAVNDLSASEVATIQAGYQHNISLPHTGVGYKRGGANGEGEEEEDGGNGENDASLPVPAVRVTNQRARQLMVAGGLSALAAARDQQGKQGGWQDNAAKSRRSRYQDESSEDEIGRSGLGRKKVRKG